MSKPLESRTDEQILAAEMAKRYQTFHLSPVEHDTNRAETEAERQELHVVIFVGQPGPMNYLAQSVEVLLNKGVHVTLRATEEAKGIIETTFKDRYTLENTLPADPDCIFVAHATDRQQLLKEISTYYDSNKVPLVMIEDAPGCLKDLLEDLKGLKMEPNLILASSYRSAQTYVEENSESYSLSPKENKNTLVIPVGRPFEERAHPDAIRARIKEQLNVDVNSDFIVTYISAAANEINVETLDVNDLSFITVLQEVATLAQQQPERNFVFIHLPHPRSTSEFVQTLIANPEKLSLPPNVRIVSREFKEYRALGLSSTEISLVSNAAFTIGSIVLPEISLSIAGSTDQSLAIPAYVGLEPYAIAAIPYLADTYEEAEKLGTPVVKTAKEIAKILHQAQDEKATQQINDELMRHYSEDFRTKADPSLRLYLWVKFLLRQY